MLYFLSAFIIFILFLAFQRDKRTSVKYLVSTVFVYILAIVVMILYLSRDVRYYNIIENYFFLPKSVWKTLMFSSLSKNTIIRFLNLFSLLTIFMGCQFSMTYQNRNRTNVLPRIRKFLLTVLGLELLFYDPFVEKLLYLFFYPYVMDSAQYELFLRVTHIITLVLNNILVLSSILNLFHTNRQIYYFPYFKYFAFGETISYTLIMISYLFLFGQLPDHMLRFSRISGYTSYDSLALYQNQRVYFIFPYYLLFSAVLMGISIITLAIISKRLNANDFSISSQIDAADTTSKTFCHYMKNELLAIQAETQLLEVSPESREELEHVLERCHNLYDRLDTIHHSTKTARLTLESTDLEALIDEMLKRMTPELKDCKVEITSAGHIPPVLLDANYFEQALHNIVTNAVDAMQDLPAERKNLHFTLRAIDNWVALSVTDTGPGISQQNLGHIFEPFFSSQPIAEHWGIGLTMTYRIVQAHKGRISVESREGKGTTFRILLPNLKEIIV